MPRPWLREFRDNVVALARHWQPPLTQIAMDFGISEAACRTGAGCCPMRVLGDRSGASYVGRSWRADTTRAISASRSSGNIGRDRIRSTAPLVTSIEDEVRTRSR